MYVIKMQNIDQANNNQPYRGKHHQERRYSGHEYYVTNIQSFIKQRSEAKQKKSNEQSFQNDQKCVVNKTSKS